MSWYKGEGDYGFRFSWIFAMLSAAKVTFQHWPQVKEGGRCRIMWGSVFPAEVMSSARKMVIFNVQVKKVKQVLQGDRTWESDERWCHTNWGWKWPFCYCWNPRTQGLPISYYILHFINLIVKRSQELILIKTLIEFWFQHFKSHPGICETWYLCSYDCLCPYK